MHGISNIHSMDKYNHNSANTWHDMYGKITDWLIAVQLLRLQVGTGPDHFPLSHVIVEAPDNLEPGLLQ